MKSSSSSAAVGAVHAPPPGVGLGDVVLRVVVAWGEVAVPAMR